MKNLILSSLLILTSYAGASTVTFYDDNYGGAAGLLYDLILKPTYTNKKEGGILVGKEKYGMIVKEVGPALYCTLQGKTDKVPEDETEVARTSCTVQADKMAAIYPGDSIRGKINIQDGVAKTIFTLLSTTDSSDYDKSTQLTRTEKSARQNKNNYIECLELASQSGATTHACTIVFGLRPVGGIPIGK